MDLSLSDDQKLLKETVERLMQDNYDMDRRRKYSAEPTGYSADNWRKMAELGLLGLPFEEEYGLSERHRQRRADLRPGP